MLAFLGTSEAHSNQTQENIMRTYNEGDSSSMQPPDILSSSSQGASECSMSSQELGAVWLADAATSSGCCQRLLDQAQPGSDCSQWRSSCSTSCSSSPSLQTDEINQHVRLPHRHRGYFFHSRAISNSCLALLIYSSLLGAPTHAARVIEAPASDPQVSIDVQLAFIYLPDSVWCTVAVAACRALIVQPYMLKAVFQALLLLVCRHNSYRGTHP